VTQKSTRWVSNRREVGQNSSQHWMTHPGAAAGAGDWAAAGAAAADSEASAGEAAAVAAGAAWAATAACGWRQQAQPWGRALRSTLHLCQQTGRCAAICAVQGQCLPLLDAGRTCLDAHVSHFFMALRRQWIVAHRPTVLCAPQGRPSLGPQRRRQQWPGQQRAQPQPQRGGFGSCLAADRPSAR